MNIINTLLGVFESIVHALYSLVPAYLTLERASSWNPFIASINPFIVNIFCYMLSWQHIVQDCLDINVGWIIFKGRFPFYRYSTNKIPIVVGSFRIIELCSVIYSLVVSHKLSLQFGKLWNFHLKYFPFLILSKGGKIGSISIYRRDFLVFEFCQSSHLC